MFGHPRTEIVAAGENVEDPWRQNLARGLTHAQRRERRIGRRLLDHGVAGIEGLDDTTDRDADRNVPWRDDPDHAERPVAQLDPSGGVVPENLARHFDGRQSLDLQWHEGKFLAALRERLPLLANEHLC